MRPDRLPHPQSLIPIVTALGEQKLDLELFVLKSHLIIEREMYGLLSMRLGVEEKHLPPLTYFPLAKLALGGAEYNTTLLEVIALNDLRNEYGHELAGHEPEKQMKALAERTGTFWPNHSAIANHDGWRDPRDRSVRAACIFCIGDVWVHIIEFAQKHGLYPSASAKTEAAKELTEFREGQRQRRKDEKDLGPWFANFLRECGVV
jgi:hypothetical protein